MNIRVFFTENWKLLTAAAVAVVLVVGGVGFWKERKSSQEQAASALLFEAQTQAQGPLAQKNISEVEKIFAPLLEKYPRSRAAYEATLQIGDLWMDAGSFAEAVKRYDQAVGMAKDSFSKLLAKYNAAVAKEAAGQYQEAVQSYEEARNTEGSDFLKPEILLAQARCFEALKQVNKAVEIYQEIQKKFADRAYYSGAAAAFEKQLSAGNP